MRSTTDEAENWFDEVGEDRKYGVMNCLTALCIGTVVTAMFEGYVGDVMLSMRALSFVHKVVHSFLGFFSSGVDPIILIFDAPQRLHGLCVVRLFLELVDAIDSEGKNPFNWSLHYRNLIAGLFVHNAEKGGYLFLHDC